VHLWPERVVLKCAEDRSLAIAHGLEEVFWHLDEAGTWQRRAVEDATIHRLVSERTSATVEAALKVLLSAPASSGSMVRGSGRKRVQGVGTRRSQGAGNGVQEASSRTLNPDMHPFHDYLCGQLDDMLKKRGIVVFYDPRREFEPFFDRELQEAGTGYDGLPRVFVKERLTFVARHEGSFFALRNAVEPIPDLDKPEPLILYLPGVERGRQASVLMELEKSGTPYEPQLKRLALNVLRNRFTDGQIDEMLRPTSVTYDDIVAFLEQGNGGQIASVLHTLFGGAQGETLLSPWLASEEKDTSLVEKYTSLVEKDAIPELLKLIEARL